MRTEDEERKYNNNKWKRISIPWNYLVECLELFICKSVSLSMQLQKQNENEH